MRKLLFAAALLLGVPVAAQAVEPIQVDRDGYRFSYVVTPQADGTRLITGRDLSSDAEFSFRVKGRIVKGEVDGRPVSFTVPQSSAASTVLAPLD